MHDDLDYHCLKRSLEFLVEQYMPAQRVTAGSDPVRLLECAEQRSMTEAQRYLSVAIGDPVEATRGFSISWAVYRREYSKEATVGTVASLWI